MPFLISHSIDFTKLIKQLLDTIRRQPIRSAWLKALMKPFETIHQEFLTVTDAQLEDLKYNGQTFVLERMLIARFGAGIYITNNLGSVDGTTIGTGTDWNMSIGSGFDFDGGIGASFSVAQYDFTVHVSSAIIFVSTEMEAFVRKYKLFGTTFNIVIF